MEAIAVLTVKDGQLSGKTSFKVATADFDIKIPKLVVKNIAEVIDVQLAFDFKPIDS